MPQLDKFTFSSQVVYVLVIFFILYFLTLKIIIPQIASIFKCRQYILEDLKNPIIISLYFINYLNNNYINDISIDLKKIFNIVYFNNILLDSYNKYVYYLYKNYIIL